MTTYVAVSASTTRDYNFTLPLAALFWRDLVGFKPISLLAGDWTKDARVKCALDALAHHGLPAVQVGALDGYDEGTAAQNVRQHAAGLPALEPDAWLIPSDADLWPLKRDWYHQHEGSDKQAFSYFSNGDHFVSKQDVISKLDAGNTSFQSLPTCHIAARVLTWRELYALTGDVAADTKRTLDGWLAPKLPGKAPNMAAWESWMSDQRIMTEKFCRASWFPDSVAFIPRVGPPSDRLDRGDWDPRYVKTAIDAHVLRPPDREGNWHRLLELVKLYLPQHVAWADEYRNRYKGTYVDY